MKTIKQTFSKKIIDQVILLIRELKEKNYYIIHTPPFHSRVSVDDIKRVILEYNKLLTDITIEDIENTEVIKIDIKENMYAIDLDLWTIEEGHSDLTIQLEIEIIDNEFRVGIEDLHVL